MLLYITFSDVSTILYLEFKLYKLAIALKAYNKLLLSSLV